MKYITAVDGIFMVLVLANVALWFSVKGFIRSNGFETTWNFSHVQDLRSLSKLASREFPADVREKARFFLVSLCAGTALVLIFAVLGIMGLAH